MGCTSSTKKKNIDIIDQKEVDKNITQEKHGKYNWEDIHGDKNADTHKENKGRLPIDLKKLLSDFGDKEFVDMVVVEGMNEFKIAIETMEALIGNEDLQNFSDLKIHAHSVKGSAANITCLPLSDIAKEIEVVICNSDGGNIVEEKKHIKQHLINMKTEIDKINKACGF